MASLEEQKNESHLENPL